MQGASTHARFFDHAGLVVLAFTRRSVLPSAFATDVGTRNMFTRLNGWPVRSPANASPPSSRRPRMTRGRCGSLLLHRIGLAPTTRCRSPGALRTTAATPVILAGSRPAVPPLPSVRQIGPQSHRKSSGATCDPLVHPGTHAHASRKSDRIRRLTSTSSTLTPRPNPHSARGTLGAPHPAISCLGAFRTLAAAARGWSWHSGVRKPAHNRTSARPMSLSDTCFRIAGHSGCQLCETGSNSTKGQCSSPITLVFAWVAAIMADILVL